MLAPELRRSSSEWRVKKQAQRHACALGSAAVGRPSSILAPEGWAVKRPPISFHRMQLDLELVAVWLTLWLDWWLRGQGRICP